MIKKNIHVKKENLKVLQGNRQTAHHSQAKACELCQQWQVSCLMFHGLQVWTSSWYECVCLFQLLPHVWPPEQEGRHLRVLTERREAPSAYIYENRRHRNFVWQPVFLFLVLKWSGPNRTYFDGLYFRTVLDRAVKFLHNLDSRLEIDL